MLTIKQLEALVWIDKLGSFDRAANRLGTSQSAISKRVKDLEHACRVVIFDRSRRDGRLTDDGRRLVEIGQRMLALQSEAVGVKHMRDVPAATLKLGVTEFTALTWFPRFISRLRSEFPQTVLEPRVEESRNVAELLDNDEIDLAVIPEVASDTDMTSVPLASLDRAWLAHTKLVPARERPTLQDISRFTVLTQGKRSAVTAMNYRWMRQHGAEPANLIDCNNLIAQLGLALAGIGICCLPIASLRPMIRPKLLRIIDTMEAPPPLVYAARYRTDRATKFLRTVVAIAQEECDYGKQLILRS